MFLRAFISLFRFLTSPSLENMSLRSDSEKQPPRHLSMSATQREGKT